MKNYRNQEITKEQFQSLTDEYLLVIVDLGCGDGRFVYKSAIENPQILFIGIDPAPKQMEEYTRKANRKKLENLLFITGSLELLPQELHECADKLYIILPWGTLLKAIVHPTTESIAKIKAILKTNGEAEMIFGYNPELEPSETSRLELNNIDENYVKNEIINVFEKEGLKLKSMKTMTGEEIKSLESNWGKRISVQADRPIFRLHFVKSSEKVETEVDE